MHNFKSMKLSSYLLSNPGNNRLFHLTAEVKNQKLSETLVEVLGFKDFYGLENGRLFLPTFQRLSKSCYCFVQHPQRRKFQFSKGLAGRWKGSTSDWELKRIHDQKIPQENMKYCITHKNSLKASVPDGLLSGCENRACTLTSISIWAKGWGFEGHKSWGSNTGFWCASPLNDILTHTHTHKMAETTKASKHSSCYIS